MTSAPTKVTRFGSTPCHTNISATRCYVVMVGGVSLAARCRISRSTTENSAAIRATIQKKT